jgi:hypothetical protein
MSSQPEGSAVAEHFIHRTRLESGYNTFRAGFFDDRRISAEARLVLACLLERPPTWKVKIGQLIDQLNWCRNKVYRVLGELREAGFILHIQKRGKGAYAGNLYYVFDDPAAAGSFLAKRPDLSVGQVLPDADPTAYDGDEPDTSSSDHLLTPAKTGASGSGSAASPKRGSPKESSPKRARLVTTDRESELTGTNLNPSDSTSPSGASAPRAGGDVERPREKQGKLEAATQPVVSSAANHLAEAPPPDGPKHGTLVLTAALVVEAQAAWNEMAAKHGLSQVTRIGDERRKGLRKALIDLGGIAGWREACARIARSGWCTGKGRGGWKADFDFLLQPTSRDKIMDGRYDDEFTSIGAAKRAAEVRERKPAGPSVEAVEAPAAPAAHLPAAPAAPALPLDDPRVIDLGRDLLRACGDRVDPHRRGIKSLTVPAQWLAAGCKWTLDIQPAITETLGNGKGSKIFSWALFTDAVMANLSRRTARNKQWGVELVAKGVAAWNEDGTWRMLVEKYSFNTWDSIFASIYDPRRKVESWHWDDGLGPKPGEEGCLAPPLVQERYGFKPTPDCIPRWEERMARLYRIADEEQAENERLMAALDAKRAKAVEAATKRGENITGNVGMTFSLKSLIGRRADDIATSA